MAILIIVWIVVRPGVFTIQPVKSVPDGVTIIYYSRGENMPFFSSPDEICLKIEGSVSLLCRGIAISESKDIQNRTIIRLPYIEWTYLQSTGGRIFDQ
jgi:hypothetical protein